MCPVRLQIGLLARPLASGLALFACGAFPAANAAGQGGELATLEEIVVTAQKRAERLQDVPIAITAFSAESLQTLGVANIQSLTGLAPGLQIKTNDAASNPKIFIRGVGMNDFNPNVAGAVGIYVDGVYVGSPIAQLGSWFDLERIEVLRGPQGTLYGRNTTGGAINVITKRPTDTFASDVSVEYGRFHAANVTAAVGGPIAQDKLAFRAAAQFVEDDGTTFNRYTGDGVNDASRWGGRLSLLYTPVETLEVLAQVHGGRNEGGARQTQSRPLVAQTPQAAGPDGLCAPAYYDSGACTNVLGYADTDRNPHAGSYNLQERDEVRLFGASVQVSWDLGNASLVSISAYDRARRNALEDTDASPNQLLETSYIAEQDQFSQEVRLQSDQAGALQWVAGLYYLRDRLETNSEIDVLRELRPLFVTPENPTGVDIPSSVVLVGYPYTQDSDSYAAFGQLDYDLTDRLTATAGLRWSEDRKDFDYVSNAEGGSIVLFEAHESKSFSSLSGRLGLQYKLSADAQLYVNYDRGFKSGGFFGGYTGDPADLEPFRDEQVDAYEIGAKTELFGRQVRWNTAAFFYDYQDLQVFTLVERNGVTVQALDNASNARIYGAESEITLSPLDHLDVSLGVSVLRASYQDYRSFGEDLSGNRLPSAPKLGFNAALNYEYPIAEAGSLVANVSGNYRSKVYLETRNIERLTQPGYWLLDAQLGWKSETGRFSAGLWGRNLFDRDYVVDVSNLEAFGFDALSFGAPRTYGVYFRFSY